MATRLQIAKLTQRIEALAPQRQSTGHVPAIIVDGESEDAALDRHCRAHPGAREASRLVFLKIVDPIHNVKAC